MSSQEVTAKFSRHLIGLTKRLLSPDRIRAVKEAQIRRRAYRLWEEAGRPWGREEEFWLAGEREYVAAQLGFYGPLSEPALPVYTEKN